MGLNWASVLSASLMTVALVLTAVTSSSDPRTVIGALCAASVVCAVLSLHRPLERSRNDDSG